MTNIENIMFNAKYSVRFMNGLFVISGFNHTKSLHIQDAEFSNFLHDYSLAYYSEEDWNELVEELSE